ncbi:hypothetical protein B0T24DRAFT_363893 [Lasiosphaeria ovina]|uniref:Uncharacterized protein n=1 Tax=Lasiosphaeria ovina TaxID=92902 RepID=A0AAE0N514_9PEZI|nr:hypothetical protein B0T24DRAFT_363893 [Lasiosphaeria ovina]
MGIWRAKVGFRLISISVRRVVWVVGECGGVTSPHLPKTVVNYMWLCGMCCTYTTYAGGLALIREQYHTKIKARPAHTLHPPLPSVTLESPLFHQQSTERTSGLHHCERGHQGVGRPLQLNLPCEERGVSKSMQQAQEASEDGCVSVSRDPVHSCSSMALRRVFSPAPRRSTREIAFSGNDFQVFDSFPTSTQ